VKDRKLNSDLAAFVLYFLMFGQMHFCTEKKENLPKGGFDMALFFVILLDSVHVYGCFAGVRI
jgi:hypothetical protein